MLKNPGAEAIANGITPDTPGVICRTNQPAKVPEELIRFDSEKRTPRNDEAPPEPMAIGIASEDFSGCPNPAPESESESEFESKSGLDVSEKNEMLRVHLEQICAKPSYKVGDLVELNDLGRTISKSILEIGQIAVVRCWGKSVIDLSGHPNRDTLIAFFDRDGEYCEIPVDGRFVKKVEEIHD